MASGIYVWTIIVLFRNISASPLRYSIHSALGFEQAMQQCSPGVLTTLATEQEASDILQLVSTSGLNQTRFTFWVGLRKDKDMCVVPSLPLRGFTWTEDGRQDSQVSRWAQEPRHTCTSVLCAALTGQLDGSAVTWWGLTEVACKTNHSFICKSTGPTLKPPRPAAPEPERTTPKPTPPTQKQNLDLTLKPGAEPQGPDPGPGSVLVLDSCQNPFIPGARFLRLDPNNSSRIQVECWSSVQLDLFCWGQPTVWRLLDSSAANFSSVCQCADGFQKDASGNCVDIDECSSAPCRHTCLNTEGSYRCVCSNKDGKQHSEDTAECSHAQVDEDGFMLRVLVPVLVSVAALVVLLAVVAVTVKCCLRRRSKKRAMKRAQKMKSKNSKETAYEKVAV